MVVHRSRTVLLAVVTAAAATAAFLGCGSSDGQSQFTESAKSARDGGGEFEGLVAIDVSPETVDLVAGDKPQSQSFTARGHFNDGTTRDLTAQVRWSAGPAEVVTANGPVVTPTGNRGGSGTVTATAGGATGSARVHVKWTKTVTVGGASPDAQTRFDGAAEDPTLAPALAYPLAGSLVPPNLPPMEIQFKPAAGTTLFDVSIQGPTLDVHIVGPCTAIGTTGGCGLIPDATLWQTISATLEGEDPATVRVRAVGDAAGKLGTSSEASLQFASAPIRGGLYYFNTQSSKPDDKPGIYRYDFETNQVGAFFTKGKCAGCHALTKDGTKMLAPYCTDERDCGRPMGLAVVDVATRQVVTPPLPVSDADTVTWSPDNAFYVTTPQCAGATPAEQLQCKSWTNGVMTLISAATNTVVGKIPAGQGAMYPSFSNDGKRLVYARAGTFRGPLQIQKSSIFWLDFDGTQNPPTWGAEKALVTSSGETWENDYHPSFSPDDKWVVFSRSHCEAGDDPNAPDINTNVCDSYNDSTARTWMVAADGGKPIELAKANGAGRNTNSWPKWAPFLGHYKGGDVLWLTISSARDYGLRALHTRDAQGNPKTGVQQLWLVGIDVTKAQAGEDPSFAPIWLPFQDVESSNHIGQWTTKIIGSVN